MLKNYFRTALRNLWRHKGFSLLNILGLTIGMTAFFLIFLYVCFELSYDSFHSRADRLYRIVCDIKTPTEKQPLNNPPWAVPPHLVTAAAAGEFPEIEQAVRITLGDNWIVTRDDQHFEQDDVSMADSNFFQVFDFPLLRGDRRTALKNQYSIVLSETTAKKFFGNIDPMGKTLTLTRDKFNATVTGIMKDIPDNSQIKASMIISMNTLTQSLNRGMDDQWDNYGANAYLLLKPGANIAALQARFPAWLEKMDATEMRKNKRTPVLSLEPLRDVYLYSTRDDSKTGHITNVYIFSLIGLFILLIACINFINLTTARSAERAREVGIRKVMGSTRGQLAGQFIGESIILCIIAFLLAVLFTALFLPAFNHLSGKLISTGIFRQPAYLLILFGISVLIGIAAGFYPALVLSSFQPVAVLKGRFSTGTRGLFLRKSLVIVQFTIATALIIGTLVVYHQLNFMRNQDLGLNVEQKLILNVRGDSARFAFKREVSALSGVTSTAMTANLPGGGYYNSYVQLQNRNGDLQMIPLDINVVDFDYLPQAKIKVLAGRIFSPQFLTDTAQSLILNESAVKLLGYTSPDQAIGRQFEMWGQHGMIIGVVNDFHTQSLRNAITPLGIRVYPRECDNLCVQVTGKNLPATVAAIEKLWMRMLPDKAFSYFFLDEFFDRQYRSEDRFGHLFLYFSVLAIFISCLGLMGLASYSTLQRTKEIGVRKIVGASVGSIVLLLSRDFLKLVVWAFLVAAPLSWFFVDGWLKGFAYRISAYWWIFAVAGLTAFFIALFTISFQAIRAALANPVNSLRSE